MSKVLVIGLGDVGQHILELLARTPGITTIIGASPIPDDVRKVYRARCGAAHQGFYPHLRFVELDLNDCDQTVALLKQLAPAVILNTASMQSWWVIDTSLPRAAFEKLDAAGYGPWIPLHLTLTYKLMQAIKRANIDTRVVSAPFPDAVNAVLGKIGLAPTVGMGNIDLMIPGIQQVVAEKFNVSMRDVVVFAIAAHFVNDSLSTYGRVRDAPYFLKILIDDKNVTTHFDLDTLLIEAHRHYPQGRADHFLTASSGVKNCLAILNDTGIFTHAPGPAGLPGGYPIRLDAEGANVTLPSEISMEDAIRINEEGLRCDGIEKIESDGTVRFTDQSIRIMRDVLGYHCETLRLTECEAKARLLKSLYETWTNHESSKCTRD